MADGSRDRRDIIGRSQDAANLDVGDLSVGATFSLSHTFDSDSVDRFAELCGDFNPLHIDDVYAEQTEFGGRLVHGMLLASLFSTLVGMRIPGRRALYLGQELSFRRPVLVGETITATAKIASVSPALGLVQLTTTIVKADQSVAVTGTGKVRVRSAAAPQPTVTSLQPVRALEGQRTALVTGASRGLGEAIAKRLARDGYAVGINYRSNEAAARRVVDDIAAFGGTAVPLCADVRQEAAVEWMVSSFVDRFGRIDLLVNNAAPPYQLRSAREIGWSDIADHLEGSVRAPLAVSRAAYSYLRAASGAIVNILSQVVEAQPPAHMLDYVIGKFGLLGLTRSLAVEWAADGIRVNGVAPSLIETDMTSHFTDRVFKLEASRTPLRRLATAEDVAGAVSYLGGSDATFITGLVIAVTGGRVMK